MKTPREARVFTIHRTMARRRESALFRQYTEDMDASINFVEVTFNLVKSIKEQMRVVSRQLRAARDRVRHEDGSVPPDHRVDNLLEYYRDLREWKLPQAIFDHQAAIDEHQGDMYMGFGEREYDSED